VPASRNRAMVRFQLAWTASYAAKGAALLLVALFLLKASGGGP
jgi:hypothetical protein